MYDELCVFEELLCGDLEVDHFFDDGVAAVVSDCFECVFFALGGLDYEDVAACALADLSEFAVGDALDLDLVVKLVHLNYMRIWIDEYGVGSDFWVWLFWMCFFVWFWGL